MPAYGTHFTLDVEGQEDETFAVVEFHHQESFSSLFTLSVTAASNNPAVPLDQLLESNVTLTIFRDNVIQRSIRGIVITCEEENGGAQQLILCDSAESLPDSESLNYNPSPGEETLLYHVTKFRRSAQIRPASVTTQDYTFKSPSWPGNFSHEGDRLYVQYPIYEFFDYPGRFKDEAHGQAFTHYQTEGLRNNAETVSGVTDSPKLCPGVRFELKEHPRADLNVQWQVVSSTLRGSQPQALIGYEGAGTSLSNDFQVIPGKQTWRPAPQPKPQMGGPQTAVVTGPPGEEIFCDEHGRGWGRVKFTWDRYNPADDSSSCCIRVSQVWAGAGFGHIGREFKDNRYGLSSEMTLVSGQ
ncbi:type VI secretion system tip protein TssI/VgrG [Citrobacter koseri]|uniref:type VI secretion system tip protein TssI/VgrG n=1 Tax=Citrobacter koseri TaxID=545 RepID=UPI0028BDBDD1|nr:type VI secretion system tip protein TssI/VgrG [Citrobacter koseri]MDT7486814.1 type VI secretion system tip protein TssI/VgrG [Citrobacter koseri]